MSHYQLFKRPYSQALVTHYQKNANWKPAPGQYIATPITLSFYDEADISKLGFLLSGQSVDDYSFSPYVELPASGASDHAHPHLAEFFNLVQGMNSLKMTSACAILYSRSDYTSETIFISPSTTVGSVFEGGNLERIDMVRLHEDRNEAACELRGPTIAQKRNPIYPSKSDLTCMRKATRLVKELYELFEGEEEYQPLISLGLINKSSSERAFSFFRPEEIPSWNDFKAEQTLKGHLILMRSEASANFPL